MPFYLHPKDRLPNTGEQSKREDLQEQLDYTTRNIKDHVDYYADALSFTYAPPDTTYIKRRFTEMIHQAGIYHQQLLDLPPGDPSFPTRDAALDALKADGTRTLAITYLCTDHERNNWFTREQERFRSGNYIPVPWARAFHTPVREWNTHPLSTDYHAAHLSLSDPGMIAYTPSDDFGMNDRQLRTTPGRYLEKFYAEHKSQHLDWVAACNVDKFKLSIARTTEDIVRVYKGGPTSCMGHKSDHEFTCNTQPVKVYGNSDLGVAYYGDIDRASARCIVWPDRMLYGRIYGDTDRLVNGERVNAGTLAQLLRLAGYSRSRNHEMTGARIHAIEWEDGVYVMPYIDGHGCCSLVHKPFNGKRKHFVIDDGDSEYDCARTDGISSDVSRNRECDHCGNEYDPDREGDGAYCGECHDMSRCDVCSQRTSNDDTHMMRRTHSTLCSDCYDEAERTCQHCDGTWHEDNLDQDTYRLRRGYTADLRDSYCPDCAPRMQLQDGTYLHSDDVETEAN